MAIAVKSIGAAGTSSTTTLTLSKPTSPAVVSGDVLVMYVAAANGTASFTTPTGWSVLVANVANATSVIEIAIYNKVAGASEPTTYSVPIGATVTSWGIIVAYSGVDNVTPIDAASPAPVFSTNTASPTSPSITTVTANAMLLGMDWSGLSVPTSAVWTVDTSSFVTVGGGVAGHIAQAVAGASGTKAWSVTKGANYATMSALRPAGGAAPQNLPLSTSAALSAATLAVTAPFAALASITMSPMTH